MMDFCRTNFYCHLKFLNWKVLVSFGISIKLRYPLMYRNILFAFIFLVLAGQAFGQTKAGSAKSI